VSEGADLAHEVLIRVAEFIRKLPAEALADLVSGEARLDIVPKGGRRGVPTKAATAALPRPAADIAATAREIGDRVAVRRYLETDLKLTVAKLQQFADGLGVTVRKRKPEMLDDLVEWLVGRESDAAAISRAGGGR
jgi:hypothetical protein